MVSGGRSLVTVLPVMSSTVMHIAGHVVFNLIYSSWGQMKELIRSFRCNGRIVKELTRGVTVCISWFNNYKITMKMVKSL